MGWTCPCGTSNADSLDRFRSCGKPSLFQGRAFIQRAQPSEDRRDQLRAIRLVAVIILVSVIGLWILIKALSSGPAEQNQSAATVQVKSTMPPEATAAPTPTPEPDKAHAVPGQPSLSADELQRLNQERQYALKIAATAEDILNTPSFAARAEKYCRFTMEQAESLMMPGKMSGEQIEDRYQELLRSQPTTQEDELKRQQQLSILQEFMAAHRRNLSQCQGMMVVGQFEFSSD